MWLKMSVIRKEPYITTVEKYYNKVNIQLAGYSFLSTGKKDVYAHGIDL